MTAADFWSDQAAAQKLLQRRKRLEADLGLLKRLRGREDDTRVLMEWLEAGEDVQKDLGASLDDLQEIVEAAEIKKMLGGEHDRRNAIVTIHPGAGGTESQDWAEMLLRMYLRWTRAAGFKRERDRLSAGRRGGPEERHVHRARASTPTATCSAEAGVHRLVRISPVRLQTRGATPRSPRVFVWPELPEDVDIEIEDKDIRIDTYRSSGAGGQHVNVTDSAVRITHLPTGIVVVLPERAIAASATATRR